MGVGLETLFHLIYELFHWLVDWAVPRLQVVELTDRGVKVTGPKHKVLEPGKHLYHRKLSTVYTTNVRRQTHALPDELLTTKDKRRVRVGGILVYKIEDIEKWILENEDSADAVGEMAAHALREVVIDSDFADLQQPRTRKRDELTKSAQEMLGMFGVRVEYLRLTTFAETEARDVHHSGSLISVGVALDEDND